MKKVTNKFLTPGICELCNKKFKRKTMLKRFCSDACRAGFLKNLATAEEVRSLTEIIKRLERENRALHKKVLGNEVTEPGK